MMTKEEIAEIVSYCEEKKISYKQRLAELGINTWAFYDAKRKYAPKQEGDNAGEFLQLIPGGSFLPYPIKPSRSRSAKQKRKWSDALDEDRRTASEALYYINKLYHIENEGNASTTNSLRTQLGRLPSAGRTSFSAGIAMPPYAPQSYAPWWTVARPWALTRENGWKISW